MLLYSNELLSALESLLVLTSVANALHAFIHTANAFSKQKQEITTLRAVNLLGSRPNSANSINQIFTYNMLMYTSDYK